VAQDKKPLKLWQGKHFWYSIMPLLITLIIIGYINLTSPEAETAQTARLTPTAVSTQPATHTANPTRPAILQATILPSPIPSSTPRPNPATTATITLLGPPPASNVPLNGRLAFYWRFSEPLLPGQQFVFSLWQNEAIISEQSVSQANLGDGFQLVLDLEELSILPGTAVWQLHLEWADTPQQLLASETRSLIFLSE
jgi:hypothetical protein